jgi:DNA polymerase-4
LNRLLQKAAMRMRKLGLLARGLSVSIKYMNGGHWSDEIRFLESRDTIELLRVLAEAWSRRPRGVSQPLKVGVVLSHLVDPDNCTRQLWEKVERGEEREALNRAIDQINERLGKNTVYFGGAHTALDSAPMRIAFNRIPDMDTEGD